MQIFLPYKDIFETAKCLDNRRLYTKDPVHYQQFAQYGTSDVNWYFVEVKWLYYKNGKQISINK